MDVRDQMDICCATFDTLLRLGYPANEIGLQVGADSVYVSLTRFGTRYFFRIGERHLKIDYENIWRTAVKAWNLSSQEDRQKVVDKFEAKGLHVEMLAGLTVNGLYPIKGFS